MATIDWSWRRRASVAAIALTLVAAACGPAATSSPSGPSAGPTATVAGGEIDSVVWAGKNSVGSLDPHLSYDSGTTNYVTYAACEGLAAFDENTQVQPHLAASWQQVDPLTYTVQLRQGVTFWDGKPVTADDVVFSITRINDPDLASPLTGLTSTIESVSATGDTEITIKLNKPDPPFVLKLATPMAHVVQKAFVEQAGADFGTAADKVMCTGPFRPVQWDKGERVIFERFDGYWDQANLPKVKQLTIQELTDSATMVAGLKSGALTGTFDLDGRNAAQLESDAGLTVVAGPGNQFNYISLVLGQPAFGDPRVRQGLSFAIDRTGLAQAVSGKYGQPLKAPIPPGLSSWGQEKFQAAYDGLPTPLTPDLATAQQLITDANAAGLKAEVIIQESPTADIVGPAIQQAGASIGLEITITKLPTADWAAANFSGIQPRPFDSMLNFWAADYPDPSSDLVIPFSNPFSNVEGWEDPAYRALEQEWANSAPQSDAQADILIEMMQMLVDQTVKIPLYVDPTVMVHSTDIGGYSQTKFWFYQNFAAQLSGT